VSSEHYTLYYYYYILYTIHYTLYTILLLLYTIHYTLHCTCAVMTQKTCYLPLQHDQRQISHGQVAVRIALAQCLDLHLCGYGVWVGLIGVFHIEGVGLIGVCHIDGVGLIVKWCI
jgi:hypothetical protein